MRNWRTKPIWVLLFSVGLMVGCKYTWPEVLPAGDAQPDVQTTDATAPGDVVVDPPDSTVDSSVDAAPGICGDGFLNTGETCDDGNSAPGDGCDSTCHVEAGYTCTGTPSVCSVACGDGAQHTSEECDDGNLVDGDGCNSACMIDCSNSSLTDCNYAGSTKIATSAFLDPNPPAGFVQCAGFINTPADDVNRHWELNCLGAVRTLRIRYWETSGSNWVLLGDGTLTPDSTADYNTQTFGALSNGGTEGVLQTNGVVVLKDPPGAGSGGGTSTVECNFVSTAPEFGANDLYMGNLSDTKTLWVCSGDTTLAGNPCTQREELALVDASMGQCTYAGGDATIDSTDLAIAIYYQP